MVYIIEEVLALKDRIKVDELQEVLEAFIESQVLIPGVWQPIDLDQLKRNSLKNQLLQKFQSSLELNKESV